MRLAVVFVALFVLLSAAAPQLGPQEFPLAGTVVNLLNGTPVRNARVSLSNGEQVESDATGAFSFVHLAAGQYRIAAVKPGFEEGEPMTVDLSRSRAEVVIRLTPLASVQGRVTDAEGEPVAGVVVVAMRSQVAEGWRHEVLAGQAITDDRGLYRIPWLPAGRHLIQAAGYDEHTFAGEPEAALKSSDAFAPVFFGGSRDRTLASVVVLAPGGEAHADISITLQTGHRIRGRLVGLKPYTQPVLRLLSGDEGLGLNRSSVNFATGHFEIRNVPDGTYRLCAMGVGADDRSLSAEQEIQVAGHDVEDVSLALRPGFVVKGTVRIAGTVEPDDDDSVRQVLGEFFMELTSPDGPALTSEPAVDGAFQITSVSRGTYRVGFSLLAPLYLSSARSGDSDLLAEPELVLRSGPPANIEVVLRADGGSIEGTLAPGILRGGPVRVLLVPESSRRPPEGTLTRNGVFDFDGVAPGSYRLHAWNGKVEVEYAAPQVRRTLAGSGTRVEVQPSASTQILLKTLSEVPQ